MKCPKHIDGYVVKLSNSNKFVSYDFDEYHIPYSIKCSCGNEEFKMLINEMPTVVTKCTACSKEIIVYDLKYYPAATVIACNEKFTEYVSQDGDTTFNVSVIYEYPEIDAGEEFNPNDITWCEIYAYGIKSNKVFEIINDETA